MECVGLFSQARLPGLSIRPRVTPSLPRPREQTQPPMGGSQWGGLLGQEVGALLPTGILLLNMATGVSHQ